MRAIRWTAPALAIAFLAGGVSPAHAKTFCVNRGGCLAFADNFDSIQEAVDHADGNDAGMGGVIADTILVGPGQYDPFQTAAGNHPLTVDGSGPSTIVHVPTDVGNDKLVVKLQNNSTQAMTDLTVRLPAGHGNVGVTSGKLDRVAVVSAGTQSGASEGIHFSSFADGTIDTPGGTGARGGTLQRAQVSALIGVRDAFTVEDTVIRAAGTGAVGLQTVGTEMRHVDLLGDWGAGSVGVKAENDGLTGGNTTNVRSTIIRGFGHNFSRTGGTACAGVDCTADEADLIVAWSDFDSGVASDESGPGTMDTTFQNTAAPPGFVSTSDLHLRFDSALVDAGDPGSPAAGESATDLDRLPRKVEGTGVAPAVVDIGAFEYQRRAPVIDEATASATALNIHGKATFHGAASDPDAEPVSLSWDFGDGQSASGPDPEHVFETAGDYVVRLTARDPAGLTATRDFPISVTDQPLLLTASASTLSPEVGQAVSFSAVATDADGDTAAITWDFGDANQATGATATHTYGAPGAETVTVTASEAGGATAVQTLGLSVSPAGTAPGIPPVVAKCRVPKLKGFSLKKARKAIVRAKCKLGRVKRPRALAKRKRAKLVVKSQTPRGGKLVPRGTKVRVTLARKPRARKHGR